jgi:hypothetical protein
VVVASQTLSSGWDALGFTSQATLYNVALSANNKYELDLSQISLSGTTSNPIAQIAGDANQKLVIAPTAANAVVTITGAQNQTTITATQFAQLNTLTGGKVVFDGKVSLALSGAELSTLSSAAVKPYLAEGIGKVTRSWSSLGCAGPQNAGSWFEFCQCHHLE